MEVVKKRHPFKKMMSGHIAVVIDEFKYSGRVVIPEIAKRKPTKGVVVAKADDVDGIQTGDTVLYSQFAGYLLIFEGLEPMRVLGTTEILAILDEDSPELKAEG